MKILPRSVFLYAAGLGVLLGLSSPVFAGEMAWEDENRSYDQARRAVDKGEAMPLAQAVAQLKKTMPGTIIATEYEFEFGLWVYEFTLIDPQGNLRRVHLNALSGELVRVTDD